MSEQAALGVDDPVRFKREVRHALHELAIEVAAYIIVAVDTGSRRSRAASNRSVSGCNNAPSC